MNAGARIHSVPCYWLAGCLLRVIIEWKRGGRETALLLLRRSRRACGWPGGEGGFYRLSPRTFYKVKFNIIF